MKCTWKRVLAAVSSLALCSGMLGANGVITEKSFVLAAEDGTAINETNFPDPVFRAYVDEKFDTTDDGVLNEDEIAAVIEIDVEAMGISDLTGISYFTELKTLDCNENKLTSLDVSSCTALGSICCWDNELTSLDVRGCTALQAIFCHSNQLTSLDVSNCTKMKYLRCDDNQLTALNISGLSVLEELYCDHNQLTSLDVSDCKYLRTLYCYDNQLTSLDADFSQWMSSLNCENNQLTSLDLSECFLLNSLFCSGNQLTSLDVSECHYLTELSCKNNQLTSLDISESVDLYELSCSGNYYKINLVDGKFDLSTLPGKFDVSKASDWTNAVVDGTTLTVTDPANPVTYSYLVKDKEICKFELIPVSNTESGADENKKMAGDTNGDGEVNILDVIKLNRNLLCGEVLDAQAIRNADVDGDGMPSFADALMILKYTIRLITSF